MVTTSLILSACQDSGQSRVRVVKGGAGGGTLAPAALEKAKLTDKQASDVKDPLKLDPYIKLLAPIFSKMDAGSPIPWSAFFGLKRWIITAADAQVNGLPSVSISNSANYGGNYARQTMYDVFVDSAIYEKRNDNEKADIILNEYLTALYSFKNFSDEELCSFIKDVYKDAQGCAGDKLIPKRSALGSNNSNNNATEVLDTEVLDNANAAPESTASLLSQPQNSDPKNSADNNSSADNKNSSSENSDSSNTPAVSKVTKKNLEQGDYTKILTVKKYIFDQSTNIQHEALLKVLKDNGFDVRIFSFKLASKKVTGSSETTVIQSDVFENLLKQVKALDQTSQKCYFLQIGATADCQMAIEDSGADTAVPQLKIGFKLDKETVASESVHTLVPEISVRKYVSLDTKKEFYLVPLTSVALKDPSTGSAYRMNYLIAVKAVDGSEESWKVTGLLSMAGTVTKVLIEAVNQNACEGKLAEVKDKKTDAILVTDSKAYPDLIKRIGKIITVTPPCWTK
ncbi:MAG: hypothetical protein ACXVCN_02205 [Bdellovibrio sp.]